MRYAFIFDCVTYNSTQWLCILDLRLRKIKRLSCRLRFRKAPFSKRFPSILKRRSGVFRFLRLSLKSVFKISVFATDKCTRDDGHSRKNNAEAKCGLGLDQFVYQTAENCNNLRLLERVQLHVYKSFCLAANFWLSWSISNSNLLREKKKSILRPCY